MAKEDTVVEPASSTPDDITKNQGNSDDTESKEPVPSITGVDEAAAIPKGTIDPVYEAKARVLNHAVHAFHVHVMQSLTSRADPGDWNGEVSMAALHRCRVWLG